jgi:nucleotide-binding universal stress UspA family protein
MALAFSHRMAPNTVLAAVDLSAWTPRVLFHAVAFARLFNAELRILHVTSDPSPAVHERVLETCLRLGPYEHAFAADQIAIRTGRVSDAIAREARACQALLVVMGSRSHHALTTFLVGSTCDAVLQSATTAVLLVPPTDIDIVSIGDHVALTCGPVIAAVDLAEDSAAQLVMASRIAQVGRQPLSLMTVAKSRTSDHDAAAALRERAHGLAPVKPTSLIVRRGPVAAEISRCAIVEGAGLVVMGVRATVHYRPGAIAAAVLKTKRAFVLAVPSATRPVAAASRLRRAAVFTVLFAFMVAAACATAGAQDTVGDVRAIVDFQRAVDSYVFLHRQLELRLELQHRDTPAAHPVEAAALAAAIAARRAPPVEPIFMPRAVAAFREMAGRAARASGCDAGELRSGVWELRYEPNTSAAGTKPLTECIRVALPQLPDELEYRSAGTVLVLVDTHANLVVDVMPALLAGSNRR